jgi:hypothetical protein
VDLPRYYTVIE